MHKDSKLTKYVRNYNEGILFDGFSLIFKQDKGSFVYCKF